jgi:holo-[acyl-carrier protein] synthase
MVVGIGVDIVSVDRIREIIERRGERFLTRVFTEDEVRYCRRCAHPEQRFAARFAAKEAVLKALGVGWQKGASFRDVEVRVNALGAPGVRLSGRAFEISRERGIERVFLSLSHDEHYAVAQAVAEGNQRGND